MPSNAPNALSLYDIPRLTTLIASLVVVLATADYVFSAYAPQLGARLRITHAQLNIVGGAGSLGGNMSGPILGRIVDSHGPRILFVCAFLFLLGGYSGIRYIYDKGIPDDAGTLSTFSFCLLMLFALMTGAGSKCGITSAINTIAKTFPDGTRASANGLVVSGIGLSAFVFSSISHVFYAGNTSSFLLLLSLGSSFPMIMGFFLVRPIPFPINEEIPLDARYPHEDSSHTPLLNEGGDNLNEEDDDLTQRGTGSSSPKAAVSMELPRNVYGKKLWMSGDFWLLFSLLSLLSGTGIMYINNIGSIAQALYRYKNPQFDGAKASQWQATQVSSISLMNCAGRILIGLISDLGKNRFNVPRSYSLVLVSFLFFVSQVTTAFIDDVSSLWVASALLGLAYGSLWSLFVTVCLEWFGMPHFSENWGYLAMSPMVGGNVFSIIFGWNFDAHESTPSAVMGNDSTSSLKFIRDPTTKGDLRCNQGLKCYVDTIYLTIGVTILSIILSLWAGWRDQRRIRRAGEGELGM